MSDAFGRQKSIECRQPNDDLRFSQKPLHQVGLAQKSAAFFVLGRDLEALGGGREDHVVAEAARLAEKVWQLTKGFEQVRKSAPEKNDKMLNVGSDVALNNASSLLCCVAIIISINYKLSSITLGLIKI